MHESIGKMLIYYALLLSKLKWSYIIIDSSSSQITHDDRLGSSAQFATAALNPSVSNASNR